MSFVPNTSEEQKLMLERIGVSDFSELISGIPDEVKFQGLLDLPPTLSEFEAMKLLEEYAGKNKTASTHTCYLGGGAYDHFIPSIVGAVLQKPEFKTAYTPYQAEVSQGTLQVMYEFQSMIAELTGMDVSNASLYDAGSALAEACFMANAHNRKTEFLIAGTVNPLYIRVMNTITVGREFTFKTFVKEDGSTDLDALKNAISDKTSAVIVQQPNFFGNLEEVIEIEKITHSVKALYVVIAAPISLGLLESPGNYNADIVVGEGQSLGISLDFGGPYLGIFACKQEFVRKMPGRLCGVTEDKDGKRCYVLTLQTREQQIKREKATSNICTNQGLFMLAATVYMETMGKQGIKEVAENSFKNAHYLAENIAKLNGFKLSNNLPFFNEFVIDTPVPAERIILDAEEKGILAGMDISKYIPGKDGLMIAVTEKRSKEDLDNFVAFLSSYAV